MSTVTGEINNIDQTDNNDNEFDNYISPTFKSTPLFAPYLSPYREPGRAAADPVWGTHMHRYAGIGELPFMGLRPKTRDLYVARSHRHYLSGLSYVMHDKVTPSQITPFKKSLNRANDDLVPPAALIPLDKYSRIIENTKLVNEDKYASHQERTELFPQRGTTTELTKPTVDAIRKLLDRRYGQTTYSESYYDQREGTTLHVGPQFQFYECDEESTEDELEEAEVEPDGDNKEQGETDEEKKEDQSGAEEEEVEAAEVEDEKDAEAEETADEEENPEEKPEEEAEMKDLGDEFQDNLNIIRNIDRPFWPAWPGNLANAIDPFTLKIAEKRDVSCRQDQYDVRALPVLTPAKVKDYQILSNLAHVNSIANDKLAPAKTNFAYSGQRALYGSEAERSAQFQPAKPIQAMPGCSRFNKIPAYVDENIDRKCQLKPSLSDTLQSLQSAPRLPASGRRFVPRPPPKDDLAQLEETVLNLQKPNVDLEEEEEERTRLPPLWETLQYSGDRVVDRLGVRFKSTAQARYHNQHTEKTNIRLPERHDHVCFRMVLSTGRRRQYYNGHHMGSSFR